MYVGEGSAAMGSLSQLKWVGSPRESAVCWALKYDQQIGDRAGKNQHTITDTHSQEHRTCESPEEGVLEETQPRNVFDLSCKVLRLLPGNLGRDLG
jgi:hypothetical protein